MRTCAPVIAALALQVVFTCGAFATHAAAHFDAAQWTVKKSLAANFGPALRNVQGSLLKSRLQTGEDGLIKPTFTANVIVTDGEKVIYQFSHEPLVFRPASVVTTDTSFIDDVLELTDLTGDGVPEILFHTGESHADDYNSMLHILQYVGGKGQSARFRDLRASDWIESDYSRLGWLTYAGHRLIIFVEPEDLPYDDNWCYHCGRYHRYRVYEWDPRRQRMVLRATIPETKVVHGDDDPLQEDRSYVLEHLRRLYATGRAQLRSSQGDLWPLRPDFDPTRWGTVKTLTASFGPTLSNSTIQLLVSKETAMRSVYSDGRVASENRMVNVVVQSGGRVIYQYCWLPLAYHYGRSNEEFFKDAELELRDVTNDGIPEILFHSGEGRSSPRRHALHFDQASTAGEPFREIFLPAWEPQDPDDLKFTWFDIAGRTLAVVAVPEDTKTPIWGHRYDVYEWNSAQQAFVLSGTVPSTGQSHDETADPFTVDAEYLRAELTRRYSPTPAPQ